VKIFLYYIKGLFAILNLLIFLLLLAWLAKRFQKKRLSIFLFTAAAVLFLLCSTSYLPQLLANKLERQYPPLNAATLKNHKGKIYIHLLGSGYGADYRLPATAQLGTTAQGRLIEAIRLYRQLDSSILICSGSSVAQPEPQSQVAKKAAILLGVDSGRIITLDTPSTTQEEAAALADTIGTNSFVIIVTDAIHMPRATKLFSHRGFHTIAAPTNYKVMQTQQDLSINWWPSGGNITLMDMVIHEYLGNLKTSFSSL
jgi:uncharacterized SAM-binding protein YcdF (DUF218 family)